MASTIVKSVNPTRRPTSAQRRQQIIDAAITCVLRSGFHGASVADIATVAQLSAGNLYRHFRNKEAIIAAIVQQSTAEFRSQIAKSSNKTREAAIANLDEDVARFVNRQYDSRRRVLALEIYAEAARNPKVEAIVREYAGIERALAVPLVQKLAGPGLSVAAAEARVDLLRVLADGLLAQGVHAPCKGAKAPLIREMQRAMRLILTAEA